MILYRQLRGNCSQKAIGVHGLSQTEIDGLVTGSVKGFNELKARKNIGANALMDIASRSDDIEPIETLAEAIRRRFNHVIVVGSGGSGLSGKALLQFAPCSAPSFEFLDNIDPDKLEDVLSRIHIEHTCFIAISKSGTTVETLGQLYVLIDKVKQKGGRAAVSAQFIVITSPEIDASDTHTLPNPMRALAKEYDFRVLDHDMAIGGRFAILSIVGLLPAAIAGIDIRALRRGAHTVITALDAAEKPEDFAPALGAALHYGFNQRSRNISIFMPYSEKLSGLSAWFRQCWAESLGKEGKGTTLVTATGTTDQHSQLQLYLNGPKDKFFHIITVNRKGSGDVVNAPERKDLFYMHGKTLGDLMEAQQRATIETLVSHRCPTRVFEISLLNIEALGALLMHFTLEIIFMAYLLEVNPFDQPAVEEGKILAKKYLLDGTL